MNSTVSARARPSCSEIERLYNRAVGLSAKGESADALVLIASWNGYEVDKAQLAFWHRKDLLPTPDVRRLGKSHGTESIYPPGTAQQMLALCKIHRRHKRTADIGWRLWFLGYPVPVA